MSDDVIDREKEELEKVAANIENNQSKNTSENVYGEEFYGNPFTNPEYEKTTGEINVDKLLYNLVIDPTNSKPVVNSYQSLPYIYEGHSVITDVFEVQNLAVDSMVGLQAPQYYSEPGYLVSFILAVNDPLMALKVFVKGLGENGYNLADYSMRKMAMLGLGMTLGEAEEPIYTVEGQTSRDLSGQPSLEYPYLMRWKDLPTGTETDYEVYKGTESDAWIVAGYTPKIYPKFNSMYFDVYNSNPEGTRLIHYLQIKRFIIMDVKSILNKPDYSKSVLSLNPSEIVNNLIKEGQPTGEELDSQLLNTGEVVGNEPDVNINPQIGTPTIPNTTTASYAKTGHIHRNQNQNILFNQPARNIYSLTPTQQKNNVFKEFIDENQKISNELTKHKYKKMGNLKRL